GIETPVFATRDDFEFAVAVDVACADQVHKRRATIQLQLAAPHFLTRRIEDGHEMVLTGEENFIATVGVQIGGGNIVELRAEVLAPNGFPGLIERREYSLACCREQRGRAVA